MQLRSGPVYVRRRRFAGGALVLLLAGSVTACMTLGGDPSSTTDVTSTTPGTRTAQDDVASRLTGTPPPTDSTPATGGSTSPSTAPTDAQTDPNSTGEVAAPPPIPSEDSRMVREDYLTGGITPKSVVASGHGLVIANNMMYSHTSTVYDATSHQLLATLSDSIEAADFGVDGHPGVSKGAPVEAAWTADGKYAYVSQYTMYGKGYGREGFDKCTPGSGVGPSFVYRLNAETMAWDQIIKVGAVPKFVDITPDQKTLLVSNWCDSTLSVVDLATAKQVKTIPIAAAPRGIEVLPDNRTAYVAAMYADKLFKVDLVEGTSEVMLNTGRKPRHLNLSADGRYLFMAVSGADTIYKIDTRTDKIVDEVKSGREPRSMALSSDGTALYVVNYYEPSVAKIRTSDMTLLHKEPTDANPIGITYEPVTHSVWVACYSGSIIIFDDTARD